MPQGRRQRQWEEENHAGTRAASQNRTRAMTRPSTGRTPRLPALPACPRLRRRRGRTPRGPRRTSSRALRELRVVGRPEANSSSINTNDTCGAGRVVACALRFGPGGGFGRPRRRMVPAGRARRPDIPAAPGSPYTAPLRARGRLGPRRTKGRDRASDTEGRGARLDRRIAASRPHPDPRGGLAACRTRLDRPRANGYAASA